MVGFEASKRLADLSRAVRRGGMSGFTVRADSQRTERRRVEAEHRQAAKREKREAFRLALKDQHQKKETQE